MMNDFILIPQVGLAYRGPRGYQREQTVTVASRGLPVVSLWSPCSLPVASCGQGWHGFAWLGFDCLCSVAVGSVGPSAASVQICLASIWGLAPVPLISVSTYIYIYIT